MGCPVSCSKMSVIRRGRHRGIVADNVEYESTALLGSNLGIDNVEDLQYAAHLCDIYGMDTMSTGGVIGFAIEAYERGLITAEDTGGLELAFGAARAIHELIGQVARREGIGDLLAEGVKRAAEALGDEAAAFAMHGKGLETPGYEPRGLPAHALGYATGDRGGCHERSYTVHYEMRGVPFKGRPVDRFTREGKPEMSIAVQNATAGTDTLIRCHFTPLSNATCAELLNAATGWEISPDYFDVVGERIWNLTRLFNLREGFTRADDDLPIRVKEEGLPDPPVMGQRISQEDLDAMLEEYYRLRGWDEQGVPSEAKLAALGLEVRPPARDHSDSQ
jgi:aldehyde:ferredoxin oxidoreductase